MEEKLKETAYGIKLKSSSIKNNFHFKKSEGEKMNCMLGLGIFFTGLMTDSLMTSGPGIFITVSALTAEVAEGATGYRLI